MSGAVLDALLFRGGYNATVVAIGCIAFGVAAGALGCFVLLRGRALIADAAAHATLPGICGAFIAAVLAGGNPRSVPLLLAGAAVTAAIGVLVVNAIARGGRIRDDAAMALVISVGFGFGVVLVSVVQSLPVGGQAGLKNFILGQAAGMGAADAQTIAVLCLATLALVAALFKPLAALCFDRAFAASAGLPVRALDLALMALMLAVAVAGLAAVGLVLVVAMMVIPAATARLATERLALLVPIAATIGGASGWVGTAVSAGSPDLPTGATITLVACALFVVALLFAPSRGAVAFFARLTRLRLVVARDHALRAAHEAAEAGGAAPAWADVAARCGWSDRAAAWIGRWLRLRGLIAGGGGTVRLTPRGAAMAAELTRRHRLWERYLQSAGGMAAGAAGYGADLMEHTLPPEVEKAAAAWLETHPPAGGARR
ncbi:MAG: iron chelate uptake ABC transporter family permease subunit [Rhodospirillales bacterium]